MGQREVMQILKQTNRWMRIKEITEISDVSDSSIQSALRRMNSFVERRRYSTGREHGYEYRLK